MTPVLLVALSFATAAPFTGLFLWTDNEGSALWCQFRNTQGNVSGACYTRRIAPQHPSGIQEARVDLVGETDGSRVVLRVVRGERQIWATATARPPAIVLDRGSQRFTLRQASVSQVNSALAKIALDAANRRQAYVRVQRRQRAILEYSNTVERVGGIASELARARSDSVTAEVRVAEERRSLIAVRDSLRLDPNNGFLQTSLGMAQSRLQAAVTGVQWATDRIRGLSEALASARQQLRRDSLSVARNP